MSEEKCGECAVIGSMSKTNENQVCDATTKLVGIYGLQNKLKPDKWYIGQSIDIINTWHQRYELMHCKCQPKIFRALKKYGYNNFDKIIIEECTEETLNDKEVSWSKHYDSVENGYNTRECGGSRGRHAESTKQKMREKATGRLHTPESIEKMRIIKQKSHAGKKPTNYGSHHTLESITKIKDARAKQVMTEEFRNSHSIAAKRTWEKRRIDGTLKDIGQKISAGKIGKSRASPTEETRKKISLALSGRVGVPKTDEQKKNMSIIKKIYLMRHELKCLLGRRIGGKNQK